MGGTFLWVSYFPDLSGETYVGVPDDGYEYLSVGWLGGTVECTGATSSEVFEALRQAADSHQRDWGPVPAGPHTCEICQNCMAHHEFVVTHGRIRYLIPNMVFHYIEDHEYKLPAEVEQALCSHQ